jgi:hypothetical protein
MKPIELKKKCTSDASGYGCEHDAQEPHTRPYKTEIENDESLCDCCKACEDACAMDI